MSHRSALIGEDIIACLEQHERKELLRFITCGSVDDGKSTLIGLLLHDSKMIYEDHLAAITADTARYGTTEDGPDLALLVDGLQAEREQGITIDVAYRYYSTEKRKFIIADTPGHEQYTRKHGHRREHGSARGHSRGRQQGRVAAGEAAQRHRLASRHSSAGGRGEQDGPRAVRGSGFPGHRGQV